MPPANPNAPMLAPAVETLLGTLRRRIRQYIWLEGCAAAVAWLGVAFWVTLAADWFFEPSTAVRVVMLAAVAAVLAAVLVRLIGRRVFVRITDSNAATVLERRFPQLNDSLLTAVVLSDVAAGQSRLRLRIVSNAWQTRTACRRPESADGDLTPRDACRTCREAANRIAAGRSSEGVQSAAVVAALQRGHAADDQRGVFCRPVFRRSSAFGRAARWRCRNDLWPRNTHLDGRRLRRRHAESGPRRRSGGRGPGRHARCRACRRSWKSATGPKAAAAAAPRWIAAASRADRRSLPGIRLHVPQRFGRHSLRRGRRRRSHARSANSGGR